MRKLVKLSVLLCVSFPCDSVHAGLEGEYELVAGPSGRDPAICPMGSLQTLVVDKQKGERIMLFGSRHSWPMNMKDASEVKEKKEKGACAYARAYRKSTNDFVSTTTRSQCPSKKNDGVVREMMKLRGTELVYEFDSMKEKFSCTYKKGP